MTEKGRDLAVALGLAIALAFFASLLSPARMIRQGAVALGAGLAAWRADHAAAAPATLRVPERPGPAGGQSAAIRSAGQRAAMPADMAAWITSDDYPAEALRNHWEGRVAIRWTIDESGRARDCAIVESSGHAVLDETACRLVLERARYRPALDGEGRPVRSADWRGIVWRLPD